MALKLKEKFGFALKNALENTGGNMACKKCNDTGVYETGNNDLPCDCKAGDKALFNACGIDGQVTGKEMRQHFLNRSPDPIHPIGTIPASSLPGRQRMASEMNIFSIYMLRYLKCNDRLRQVIAGMAAIVTNKDSTEDEKWAAIFTMVDALSG